MGLGVVWLTIHLWGITERLKLGSISRSSIGSAAISSFGQEIYNLKLHKSRTMRFWLINGAVVGAVFDQKSDIQHFRSLRGVKCNRQDHPFLS